MKLFDERVVAVQPSLVRAVGSVSTAAVLQQIHYHAQAGHTKGEGWVVRTYAELGQEIGLSCEQIRRAVGKLEEMGVVESCQPEGHVRRKWYRIVHGAPALSETSNRQNRRLEAAKSPDAIGRIDGSSSTDDSKSEDGSKSSGKTGWKGDWSEDSRRAADRLMAENAEREAEIMATVPARPPGLAAMLRDGTLPAVNAGEDA